MIIKKLKTELQNTNNFFETAYGVLKEPYDIDENSYYYYLTDTLLDNRVRSATLTPVQVSGGIIQTLDEVDGQVAEPNLEHIKYLITLRTNSIPAELKLLLKENNIEFDNTTYLKYIETAKLYQKLRENLMIKILETSNGTIIYQGSRPFLPTTKSAFSLGYNEDAYIKSSIAYETEMYLRSIFSKYGLVDKDLKTIFSKHNIKDAFLKLPRTVRKKIYEEYKNEIELHKERIYKKYIETIVEKEDFQDIITEFDTSERQVDHEEKLILYDTYKLLKQVERNNPKIDDLILKIERILKRKEKTEEYNSFDSYKYNKEIENIKNHEKKSTFFYNKIKLKKYQKEIEIFKKYKKYIELTEQYNELIEILKEVTEKCNKITIKVKEAEKEIIKQDNIFKNKGSYTITASEYNTLKENIKIYNLELLKLKSARQLISKKIRYIEEEMTAYIFKEELSMETAYQDNRYTYEQESNNNYDNMLIFLNVIKKIATGKKEKTINYDEFYMYIYSKQKNIPFKPIIKASSQEIRDFDPMFSRKDERFTCDKRKTKTGVISRFYKSKKESKLDALYSAELKYLGALLIKDLNSNLYMAELGIASELYLKSLLRSNATTHELKDLYLKIDNKTKSMIIRKINQILGLELTKKEVLNILSKNNINKAFSEYRYLYENEVEKEDLNFLSAFTNALHVVVSKKIKYKSPYYDEINKINSSSTASNNKEKNN